MSQKLKKKKNFYAHHVPPSVWEAMLTVPPAPSLATASPLSTATLSMLFHGPFLNDSVRHRSIGVSSLTSNFSLLDFDEMVAFEALLAEGQAKCA